MKISKNFCTEEFLSEMMHDDLIARGLNPQKYVNKDLVMFCEWLKSKCNNADVIVNDWKWGGRYTDSGLRTCDMTQYATYSQHRYMKAVDVKVDGYSVSEIRQLVVDNFIYLKKIYGITTIEKIDKTPTWNHIDTRWTGSNYLYEF